MPPERWLRPDTLRWVLPTIALALFASEKLALNPVSIDERQADGLFYYQIAQHVAAGEGLRTSVSLYGQGLRDLPAPTTVQPLWPLLLGGVGRVIGLERAAALLPELLFFLALLALRNISNRLARALGSDALIAIRGVTLLDVGTLTLFVFGSSAVFMAYTSKAYTEGLAFTLLFASLGALPRPGIQRPSLWAFAAGGLIALAYLTRSQWIAAPLALVMALLFIAWRDRSPRLAIAGAGGVLLCVLPWVAHLASFMDHFTPAVLLDFAAYRETPDLEPPQLFVAYEGLADRAADVLSGLVHAFHPTKHFSYIEAFGPVVYCIPPAGIALSWLLWRRPAQLTAKPPREILFPLAFALVAGATLAPVHFVHATTEPAWLFGWRHGLPIILVLAGLFAAVAQAKCFLRAAVLLIVAYGLAFPRLQPAVFIGGNDIPLRAEERELVDWLDAQPEPPLLMSLSARTWAARSRATAHTYPCDRGADELLRYFESLEVDYWVLSHWEVGTCPAVQELRERQVERVRRFTAGRRSILVARLRPD